MFTNCQDLSGYHSVSRTEHPNSLPFPCLLEMLAEPFYRVKWRNMFFYIIVLDDIGCIGCIIL